MRDLPAPPFKTGDVAYTRPAPGGFASTAATPSDPVGDVAYTVPSLGGEFQPGSGAPAPTGNPITKGADADGGAADIAGAPRVGAPTPPAPPTPVQLSGAVTGNFIVFVGKASLAGTVTVGIVVAAVPTNIITNVAIGDTAGVVAANVARRLNENGNVEAVQTSNGVEVLSAAGEPVTPLTVTVTLA
jgi:hypothetical protein